MVLALATALTSDFSKLKDVFRHLAIGPLAFALFSTVGAYLASALSFNALFKMTPYRVPFPKFFSIMFISDTINIIVSSGGMSSIANRAFLLKHEKVPFSVTIPLSLAQNMIFNLVLSCVCFGALFYLHGHPEFTGGPKQALVLVFMAGLLVVMGAMMMIFLHRAFRRWVLRQILRTSHWISHKILRRKKDPRGLVIIRAKLETTVALLHKGRVYLLLVFFWIALDWCLMPLTFYFCFHAVGVDLPLGLLLVGFAVMFLSSNVNPVPAGLGVSESLVALTFKNMGVSFEKTLVAALIYRLVFFLIPLAISTALYLDTIRSFLKAQAEEPPL